MTSFRLTRDRPTHPPAGYYNPKWRDVAYATTPLDLEHVRETFIKSVEKRLMADVPYGVFLSGGKSVWMGDPWPWP